MLFKVLILGFTIALITVLWIPFESVFAQLLDVSVCDPLGRCKPRPKPTPPPPMCPGGLCPMNITMTNVANDPITLTGVFVGIDRDLTIKDIQPFIFPLKIFLEVGESFSLLFNLVDVNDNPIEIEKKFGLIIDAEKIGDITRSGDEPKIKEIKVKKTIKLK